MCFFTLVTPLSLLLLLFCGYLCRSTGSVHGVAEGVSMDRRSGGLDGAEAYKARTRPSGEYGRRARESYTKQVCLGFYSILLFDVGVVIVSNYGMIM